MTEKKKPEEGEVSEEQLENVAGGVTEVEAEMLEDSAPSIQQVVEDIAAANKVVFDASTFIRRR